MKAADILSLTVLLFTLLFVDIAHAAPLFRSGTQPLVDGVVSGEVAVEGHRPVFSWDYAGAVSSFTVTVSAVDPASAVWSYSAAVSSGNTTGTVTRVGYSADGAGLPLEAGRGYAWQVRLFDGSGTAAAGGSFRAVSSPAQPVGDKVDLVVDWNNPFDPSKGQYTKFVFAANDRDRNVKLRVFSLSGALVKEWPQIAAVRGARYTQTWDGTNDDNGIVARGIYFVNLADLDEKVSVTRRVAVVK